jgi:hypothetical protein
MNFGVCVSFCGFSRGVAAASSKIAAIPWLLRGLFVFRKTICCTFTVFLLSACAPAQLNAGAQRIKIVTSEPEGCKYLGEVTGSHGNAFTGAFTSNQDLETGARNEMKNAAAKLHADMIQLLATSNGLTSTVVGANEKPTPSGYAEPTTVTYTGAAYKCPKKLKDSL